MEKPRSDAGSSLYEYYVYRMIGFRRVKSSGTPVFKDLFQGDDVAPTGGGVFVPVVVLDGVGKDIGDDGLVVSKTNRPG